ncbi:capsid protein [Giant panda associated gemycircularvirus]|nr:capsid protein [Giant panda associated gemycircularvirus]
MAYSRYRRKTRRTYRKSTRGARPSARRSRYTVKTRRYTRKRPMSKRSVLNATSRKKRDTMLSYSNVTAAAPSGGTTFSTNPSILVGNQQYILPWVCTARDLSNASGGANIIINRSERTSTVCYMRGLAENIRIQTTNGMPWMWRRVCFTLKGDYLFNLSTSTAKPPPVVCADQSPIGLVSAPSPSLFSEAPPTSIGTTTIAPRSIPVVSRSCMTECELLPLAMKKAAPARTNSGTP